MTDWTKPKAYMAGLDIVTPAAPRQQLKLPPPDMTWRLLWKWRDLK